jgi:hypothetical protein
LKCFRKSNNVAAHEKSFGAFNGTRRAGWLSEVAARLQRYAEAKKGGLATDAFPDAKKPCGSFVGASLRQFLSVVTRYQSAERASKSCVTWTKHKKKIGEGVAHPAFSFYAYQRTVYFQKHCIIEKAATKLPLDFLMKHARNKKAQACKRHNCCAKKLQISEVAKRCERCCQNLSI